MLDRKGFPDGVPFPYHWHPAKRVDPAGVRPVAVVDLAGTVRVVYEKINSSGVPDLYATRYE